MIIQMPDKLLKVMDEKSFKIGAKNIEGIISPFSILLIKNLLVTPIFILFKNCHH